MPPSYTESYNTMAVTTWQLRRKKIVDQVLTASPVWYLLSKNGRRRSETGGKWIEEPLRYAKNETVTFIGRGSAVALQDTDNITASQWNWKYLTGHILSYFADRQKNRGKHQLINKMNADVDSLRDSTVEKLEEYLFGDGTADDGQALEGLGKSIPSDPSTGTVAGLDRATYGWWCPGTTDCSGLDVALTLVDKMRTAWLTAGRYGMANRFPDISVTTQTIYEYYEAECLEIGRIAMPDTKMADLGFGELAFKGKPITFSYYCPDYAMFMLNTNYMSLVYDPIAWFKLGEFEKIYDQPGDMVAHIMSVLNLTFGNFRKHHKLYDIGN